MQIHTVGDATLGSGYDDEHFKPYSMAEATFFGIQKTPLQQLLEDDGEWNVPAQWRADCTPLHRHHNHDDIHCGETVEHLRKMISRPAFSNVLGTIKAAWHCFLRDDSKSNRFDGLLFDPYGQNRSVALARIVWFCLKRDGVQVVEPVHLSTERWQENCCRGECTHCMNAPMSQEKEDVLDSA